MIALSRQTKDKGREAECPVGEEDGVGRTLLHHVSAHIAPTRPSISCTTLVDDWVFLTTDERRALVREVFEEINANTEGIEDFLPRELWKDYMRAVVPAESEKVPTARKTGLEPATPTLARLCSTN